MQTKNADHRLAPLDAMRGMAALAVIVYHVRHFGGDLHTYPLASATVPWFLYLRGWMFVDFFFVLSGVVLTYRYLEPISNSELDAREFFVLRLSRLYPLHLLTLLFCAAVQWTCLALNRPEIIYNRSDLYHLFLNLAYLHSGGFEDVFTYNGPSWSVAVEVIAYLAFFLFASKKRTTYIAASLCTVVASVAVIRMSLTFPILNFEVGRGLIGFFVGSLLFLAMRHFKSTGQMRKVAWSGFVAMLVLFGVTFAVGYQNFIGDSTLPLLLVIFPLVILSGLEIDALAWVLSLRPLTFLGDLSYAIYLVHVPVQMVIIGLLRERHRDVPVTSGLFLAQFFAAVLVVAFCVHKLFELPARRWFRRRFHSLGAG